MSNLNDDISAFLKDDAARRVYLQEQTIGELTEMVCREMRRQGLSQSDLAARMGRTKGYVSQLLSGGRNLTLRTLSDMLAAMDQSLEPMLRPAGSKRGRCVRLTDDDVEQWTQDAVCVWPQGERPAFAVRLGSRTLGAA